MLVSTATLAASTPAAPLMPQNQGVGFLSIADTSRIPVGNPKPMRKPAGERTSNRQSGSDQEARALKPKQDVGQPERQEKEVQTGQSRPADQPRAAVERNTLGHQAADAGRQDQAEEDDAERINRVAQKHADALKQADLNHHEADADQAEIERSGADQPGWPSSSP